MTEYTPVLVGSVTKYVVVESFDVTPADLAARAYEISQGAMIKETCFGLVINGPSTEVDRVIAESGLLIRIISSSKTVDFLPVMRVAAGRISVAHVRDFMVWSMK